MPDNYLTPADVARKLKVSRARVQQWIAEGRLASKQLPNGQHLIAARHAKRPKAMKRGPKKG